MSALSDTEYGPAGSGNGVPMSDQREGQVSEVGRLDPSEADTPIQPSDSTEGDPDTSGAGPDAAPPDNSGDRDFKPRHRKPGAPVVGE